MKKKYSPTKCHILFMVKIITSLYDIYIIYNMTQLSILECCRFTHTHLVLTLKLRTQDSSKTS